MSWRAALVLLLALMPGCASALELKLDGQATQGGLMIGHTAKGATVTLDGAPLRPSADGTFVFGFGRDHGPTAVVVAVKDGRTKTHTLAVAARQWDVQRIDGLPSAQVTPPPEVLARIAKESAIIKAARATDSDEEAFLKPFVWPADGPVAGVFGSQRILNGEPRAPHSGLDIAAPVGAPVRAAAGGRVTLAEADLYYTGGTVMIDHGHGLSTIYVHLNTVDVKQGDDLAQGAPIGTVGQTGRATGPHLHFGVSWFDVRLDPGLLLPERTQ